MNDALKVLDALLSGAAAGTRTFPPNSRYQGVAVAVYTRTDGTAIAYLTRRLVPQPEAFATISEHAVVEGERLDHIADRYFGDPELFWRIADANGALRPEALIEMPGRRLRVTLPQAIPGAPRA